MTDSGRLANVHRRYTRFSILLRYQAWLAVLVLLLTLGVGAIAIESVLTMSDLQRDGLETEAVVQDLRSVERSRSGGRPHDQGQVTRYFVQFDYETQAGEALSARNQVSPGLYESLSAGDRVPVRYLPEEPENVHMEDGVGFSLWMFVILPGAISLVGGGIAGGFLAYMWRQSSAMIRAADHGLQHAATVTDHVPTTDEVKESQVRWRLHWQDHSGHEGRSLMHRGTDLQRLAPRGAEITLHADPVTGKRFWQRDLFRPAR